MEIRKSRPQEIHDAAFDYLESNHSPSNVSECQAAMNIAVIKAYTAAVKHFDELLREDIKKRLTSLYDKDGEYNRGRREELAYILNRIGGNPAIYFKHE